MINGLNARVAGNPKTVTPHKSIGQLHAAFLKARRKAGQLKKLSSHAPSTAFLGVDIRSKALSAGAPRRRRRSPRFAAHPNGSGTWPHRQQS